MSDLTALVTGADKGIGKQIAAQLAAAGVSVHAGSRDPQRGQQAVDEIGGRARLVVPDVTDADSIADAAACRGARRPGPRLGFVRSAFAAETSLSSA